MKICRKNAAYVNPSSKDFGHLSRRWLYPKPIYIWRCILSMKNSFYEEYGHTTSFILCFTVEMTIYSHEL